MVPLAKHLFPLLEEMAQCHAVDAGTDDTTPLQLVVNEQISEMEAAGYSPRGGF